MKQSFYDWFNSRGESNELTGTLLKWFCRLNCGRMPKKNFDKRGTWESVIEKKASKSQREILLLSLRLVWAIWLEQQQDKSSCSMSLGAVKHVEPTVARLRRETKLAHEQVKTEQEGKIAVHEFEGPVGKVGYSARVTKSLGDFESVQIGVSLEMPCYVEEAQGALEFARDFCDHEIETDVGRFVDSFRIMRASKKNDSEREKSSLDFVAVDIGAANPDLEFINAGDTGKLKKRDEDTAGEDEEKEEDEQPEWEASEVDPSKLGF